MRERIAVAVLAVVVSLLTLLAVSGTNRWSGPVVVVLSPTHGVHRGDLVALVLWAVAMVVLLALALGRRSPRRH